MLSVWAAKLTGLLYGSLSLIVSTVAMVRSLLASGVSFVSVMVMAPGLPLLADLGLPILVAAVVILRRHGR